MTFAINRLDKPSHKKSVCISWCKALVVLVMFNLTLVSWASTFDLYEFENTTQEKRFKALTEELRCPKCQNQNLAASDSQLAKDLRTIVYEMIKSGKTDEDILTFMHTRYGDFILYRPPIEPRNYALWFGPFVVLLLGSIGIFIFTRNQKRRRVEKMTQEDKSRLEKLTREMEGE